MTTKHSIQQYGLCVKCNLNMAKLSSNYCKKCKVKPIKPKTVKKEEAYKVYFYKFQSKNNTAKVLINTPPNEIGYSIYSEPSSPSTRGYQPIENSELFFQATWEQFRSLKEFTACIIQSDQISIGFFIISCGTLIQTLPKYQQFIKNKVIDLPSEIITESSNLPYPITSSAQLICQDSFWENQLYFYFKDFHVKIPLFSISTFEKKLASPSLLSAMYYGGYVFSKCHEAEVWDYMKKFATQNIKRIVKKATMDNLRALIIHAHISQWIGDLNLSKCLQAHATRMSYLLGLHLSPKKLSSADRYNRSLVFCAVKTINIGFSGSQNCTTSYLTEIGTENPNLYDPSWQLPVQSSPNYSENELENQIYALSLVEYFKFVDLLIKAMWFPSFYNLETNTFNNIWNSKVTEINKVYNSSILAFENMRLNYSDFQDKVESYETHLKMTYQEAIIEMYEILKHRNRYLQPCEVTSILDHCHRMYQIFSSKNDTSPVANFFANIIGMHYLNTYPKCTPDEKVRTKQRLQDLILYIKNSFYSYFSLNYLILKTGYDLLDD